MYVAEIDAGVAVVDMDGKILSRFGERGDGPGQFLSPHGIWGDSRGNLYLCEVGREKQHIQAQESVSRDVVGG